MFYFLCSLEAYEPIHWTSFLIYQYHLVQPLKCLQFPFSLALYICQLIICAAYFTVTRNILHSYFFFFLLFRSFWRLWESKTYQRGTRETSLWCLIKSNLMYSIMLSGNLLSCQNQETNMLLLSNVNLRESFSLNLYHIHLPTYH